MSIAASLAILLATGIALLTADPRYAGVGHLREPPFRADRASAPLTRLGDVNAVRP